MFTKKRLFALFLTFLIALASFAPVAAASVDTAAFAEQVLYYTNLERTNRGIAPLIMNPVLSNAALQRAKEASVVWDHIRPDGRNIGTVLAEYGITTEYMSENLAMGGFESAKEMVDKWMASTMGHREAILNPQSVFIGIGIYAPTDYCIYGTQLFTPTLTINGAKVSAGTAAAATPTPAVATPVPTTYVWPVIINYQAADGTAAQLSVKYAYTVSSAKLYASTSTKSKRLASLSRYTECKLLAYTLGSSGSANWFLVEAGGKTGYIRASYAKLDSVYGKTTTKLYMRSGPGSKYAKVALLAKGALVSGSYAGSGYYQVTDQNGNTGYIMAKYVNNVI